MQAPAPSNEALDSPKTRRDASRNTTASPSRQGEGRGSGGEGQGGGGDGKQSGGGAAASTALADYRVSGETVRVLAEDNITSLFPVQVGRGCDRCALVCARRAMVQGKEEEEEEEEENLYSKPKLAQ